jgi:fructose/tagatose bisphosphate aldolase
MRHDLAKFNVPNSVIVIAIKQKAKKNWTPFFITVLESKCRYIFFTNVHHGSIFFLLMYIMAVYFFY